eukprot:13005139-Ditylum_brightwellii.AAC.1
MERNPSKWDPRSRVGVLLGYSRDHARNVAWILNPNTDHISAKYHVIFDDMFTTVTSTTYTDKIELWNGLFPTHTKPLDIAGTFLDDTHTAVSSPPGTPQPPASEHPDVTIRIRICIAYVQNYASVVRPTFWHILGCCCLFRGPAASHVVRMAFPIVSCFAGYDT